MSNILLRNFTSSSTEYVPYTGATTDVDLGANNLVTSGSIGVNVSSPSKTLDVDGTFNLSGACYINIPAGVDDSVVVLDSSGSIKTDEIDSRVWGSTLVDDTDIADYVPYTGATANVDISPYYFTSGGSVSGQSTFQSGLVVNDDGGSSDDDDFRVESVSCTSAFHVDASANDVIVNTDIILNNVSASTDNTVLILSSTNTVVSDEIDSRVWGSTLVDMINGYNNRVVTATDSNSLNAEANLIFDGSTLSITGATPIKTDGIGADTDNTVVIVNSSDEFKTDEIDSRVWGSSLVDYSGTPVDNQISVWTDTNTVEGNNTFTYDGSTVSISGVSPITVADIGTDTDNTVVIVNSSGSFKTDEIDSRVWGSTLADLSNGADNRVVTATDSNSLNGEANLQFDGTDLYVNGNIGIGDSTPDCELVVNGDIVVGTHAHNDLIKISAIKESDGTNNAKTADLSCVFTGSGNTTKGINALNCWSKTDASSTGNLTQTLYGGGLRNRYLIYHEGDGTVTKGSALSGRIGIYGDGDITYGVCFNAETPYVNTGTTITNLIGFLVEGGGTSVEGTITNNYGLYINDLDEGTNRYAIYTGEDDVYFGGDVGIGDSSPDCKLDVEGAIASGTLELGDVGPTDDLEVSEVNIVFINASRNNVTIGGTKGGINGQVLHIAVKDIAAGNSATIEHAEGTGNQDFYTASGADETLTNSYGGWTFVCNGSNWYSVNGN